MVNALAIRKSQLPKSQKTICAAQYVRMSTDYQRYSIENQAAVIATYARLHSLSIVRTYRDEGESGLKIRNRLGLIQLLDDVGSGHAEFDHILVYDVSRWGRFQDVDESAHYEFICKQAGIKVAYCAEQFDNDGSTVSSIVKNIKRVMAAEYSRELSVKVHAGASRYPRLGFALGGQVGYALRRLLVDEKLKPKAVLKSGDRKYIVTDHVRLLPACDVGCGLKCEVRAHATGESALHPDRQLRDQGQREPAYGSGRNAHPSLLICVRGRLSWRPLHRADINAMASTTSHPAMTKEATAPAVILALSLVV